MIVHGFCLVKKLATMWMCQAFGYESLDTWFHQLLYLALQSGKLFCTHPNAAGCHHSNTLKL
jgi:hypothetical protein